MSNFAFLTAEFPTVHEAALAAERHAAGDPTAAAFFAVKTVEVAAILPRICNFQSLWRRFTHSAVRNHRLSFALMSSEPDNLVLQLLRDMRAEMGNMRAEMGDMRAELKADIHSLRADVASDLLAIDARQAAEHEQTREQIVGLRRAVVEYHTSVIGNGILISELEARLRRVEQHLDLPPLDAH